MGDDQSVYYVCSEATFNASTIHQVKWLDPERDFALGWQIFGGLDGSNTELLQKTWLDVEKWGYQFCAVVNGGIVIAKAAIWRYSETAWDLASVTVMELENYQRGYGKSVCSFVTDAILEAGKIPTCATRFDNFAMQRTAESIGYKRIASNELPARYPTLEELTTGT